MKRVLLLLVLLVFCLPSSGQGFELFRSRSAKTMKKYSYQKELTMRQYRERQNAVYTDFLRGSWEKMGAFAGTPKPLEREIPPVIPDDEPIPLPEDKSIPFKESAPVPEPAPSPAPAYPIEEVPAPQSASVTFDFYGTPCTVRHPDMPHIRSFSEKGVADLWYAFSKQEFDNLLYDCLYLRNSLSLCDFAYVKLAEKLSGKLYGSDSCADAVVLQGYILTSSGFRLYFARDDSDTLHKLLATDRDIYYYPYLVVGGQRCYFLEHPEGNSFRVMSKALEGTAPMSMDIRTEIRFAPGPTSGREVAARDYPEASANVVVNRNLIDFYNDYPESYTGDDFTSRWSLYANTPMSESVRQTLYPSLQAAVQGKTELESVNILLNFVQTSFEYGYDSEIWGRDRAFFADETLFYPKSDCEDHAILFTRLVRDILGLDVALLYYPNHLAAAVHFPGGAIGDYVTLDGRKFVVCDPTITRGAPAGVTMSGLDNSVVVAIPL